MGDGPPPSVQMMDLAHELRQKYSVVELKQLAVLLGVKLTKRKYESELDGQRRQLLNAQRYLNEERAERYALVEELNALKREQLVDRLVPGLTIVHPTSSVPNLLDFAEFLAEQIEQAREERRKFLAEAQSRGEGNVATVGAEPVGGAA